MTGHLLLVLGVVLAAGVYLIDLRRRPYTRCSRCKGSGRVARSTSKRWGPCPKCTGKPPRRRVGAQIVRPELRRK